MSRRDDIREKIMARVFIDPEIGCWIWTGPTSGSSGRGKNYPRMSLNGRTVAVHIVMWTNEHGYIPGNRELDHKCRNRLCVRHDEGHLELVSHSKNIKRQWKARKDAMIGHNGGPPLVCEEA
ncbi:HNH endonuclease [Agrobacterium rhizogenes]|nr:HNH endonuclease [Rhizobium rhizogenes]NTI54610.1 HNH endonuclease [Rhizobium rhizogenes]